MADIADIVNVTAGPGVSMTTTFDVNVTEGDNSSMGHGVAHVPDAFTRVLYRVHYIGIPLIVCLGMVGNTLAFLVFISKALRSTSCSLYLAARSLSDTGFLITLFLTWLGDTFELSIFHAPVACQGIIFFTYIISFLSVWLVVMVTLENYIRICHPFSVSRFCNIQRARAVVAGLVITSVVLYNVPLWTMHVSHGQCTPRPQFKTLTHAVAYADMIVTLVIPSLTIILLMAAITVSLVKSYKRQSRLRGPQNCLRHVNGRKAPSLADSPQAKVTKMLFAVSFIFLLLNLPSHAVRLHIVLTSLVSGGPSQSPTVAERLQVLFQIVYYLSFAVNVAVYLACGDNFRKVFIDKYFGCLVPGEGSPNSRFEASRTSFTAVKMADTPDTPPKEEETSLIA